MPQKIDRIGQKFGRWIVLAEAEKAGNGRLRWLCQCECGIVRVVSGNSLGGGSTRSCGCLLDEYFIAIKEKAKLEAEERFWSKVNVGNEDECSIWEACRNKGGYGRFRINHETVLAHQYTWEMANGKPVPSGYELHHICPRGPNKSCVKVSHLKLATRKEHCELDRSGDKSGHRKHPERYPKGDAHWSRIHPDRVSCGEKNGQGKLTEDAVREIRAWQAKGWINRDLADAFQVTPTMIGYVVRRVSWKHIL